MFDFFFFLKKRTRSILQGIVVFIDCISSTVAGPDLQMGGGGGSSRP